VSTTTLHPRRRQWLTKVASVAAAAALVSLAAPAAPAAATYPVTLGVDCVTTASNGTYRAVFSYNSYATTTVHYAVGASNNVSPASLNGSQPTNFSHGLHRAAFTTAPVPVNTPVRWTVALYTATASVHSPTCGGTVSLPADGNGTGPVIALGLSLLIAGAAFTVHKLRRRSI